MEATVCLTGSRMAWTASKIQLLFLVPYDRLLGLTHPGSDKSHSNPPFTVYYLLTAPFRGGLNWTSLHTLQVAFFCCAEERINHFSPDMSLNSTVSKDEWTFLHADPCCSWMLYRAEQREISIRLITQDSDWQINGHQCRAANMQTVSLRYHNIQSWAESFEKVVKAKDWIHWPECIQ